jgi:hypothetical protein
MVFSLKNNVIIIFVHKLLYLDSKLHKLLLAIFYIE